MPYWLPSGLVIISDVAPTLAQLTEAGFAIPALAGAVVVTLPIVLLFLVLQPLFLSDNALADLLEKG